MLERQGTRDPITALPDPDHGHSIGVDVAPGQHPVEHRRQDCLPIGTEGDPVLEKHRLLPGAIEGQPVVSAVGRRGARLRPHLGRGLVGAVVDHHEGPALVRRPLGRKEERGQGAVFVCDGNPLTGHRAQVEDLLPAGTLTSPHVEPAVRFAGMRNLVKRGGVVRCRTPEMRQGANPPTTPASSYRHGPCRAGRRRPFV